MDPAAVEVVVPFTVPTGTVTFLFTDIEDATQRWDRSPDAMRAAMARHDALARAALVTHRGYIFKALGDAFCCAFTLPGDAIAAAVALQAAMAREDFSAVDGLRMRIALHTGIADERGGDYFGPTLNRVARLLAIAHGGQTLSSQITHDLALGTLPPGAAFDDLGTHRLRDLARPEHVFQLTGQDGRGDFPALRSLSTLPNNLPIERTSFVGRDREIDEIGDLLDRNRLVTLCGSGGVGKTRASLQIAANALDEFRDGVWLVELAPLGDGALIAPTIAGVLGIAVAAQNDARSALVAALRTQHLLLVVDNCEHLIDAVAELLSAILSGAPRVKILASSRESLKISGEVTYRMPSLSVPREDGAPLDAARAREFGGIALFVDRAISADRRFALTDDNAPIVADIVRRLDGIALAIELAAARIKILEVRQLRRKIDERLRLLTGGSRDALPRQQTLRALIDWSYDLLDTRERELFARVGVFVDGFTLDAAVAVCCDETLDEFDVLDLLASLVDKSLVTAESNAESMRYRLLESTRVYALEKLTAHGAAAALSTRHAAWIATAVERWYSAYWTTPTRVWLPPVQAELDNIRAALRWELDAGSVMRAASIVGRLEGLWFHGALSGEGRRWIETVFTRLDEPDDATVAVLWLTLARLSFAKGMVDAAREALMRFTRAGDAFQSANAAHMEAIGLRRMGRLAEAEAAIGRALRLYETANAYAAWPYVKALDTRAGILRFQGRIDEARSLRSDALERFEALGDEHGAAGVRVNLADLESLDGDPRRAIALADEAARTYHAAGEAAAEATTLINVAAYRLLVDEFEAANVAARAGLRLAVRAGWQQGIAIGVQHLATVAAARGEAERAAPLIGYVDAWYRGESFAREPTELRCYERAMTLVRARLTDWQIEPLLHAGAQLTSEEVVREALRE